MFAADHRLAGSADVKLRALADEPLLFPVEERHHCWARLSDAAEARSDAAEARSDAAKAQGDAAEVHGNAAEAQGVELRPIPTAPSAVADLVADRLGVSAVPASFRLGCRPDLAAGHIPGLVGHMSVMWRADEPTAPVRDFVDDCRTAASVLTATHPDLRLSPAI